MDRKEVESRLIEKAQRDEVFRKELIKDLAGMISKEFGVAIPPELKVTVLEEDAANAYLVLPVRQAADGELDEKQLAAVAGGSMSVGDWIGSQHVDGPLNILLRGAAIQGATTAAAGAGQKGSGGSPK